MSDNLFYRIALISFLVLFGSMLFFLNEYREKKENSIGKIFRNEQVKFLIFNYIFNMYKNFFKLKTLCYRIIEDNNKISLS